MKVRILYWPGRGYEVQSRRWLTWRSMFLSVTGRIPERAEPGYSPWGGTAPVIFDTVDAAEVAIRQAKDALGSPTRPVEIRRWTL